MDFDSSKRGALNILRACGITHHSIKRISDLNGLNFEFYYKHGIITGTIDPAQIVMVKDPGTGNEYPQVEISLHLTQSPNYICIACMVKNTIIMEDKFEWRLISNLGRTNKEYQGTLEIIYPN